MKLLAKSGDKNAIAAIEKQLEGLKLDGDAKELVRQALAEDKPV
jgi:hypothetical protein